MLHVSQTVSGPGLLKLAAQMALQDEVGYPLVASVSGRDSVFDDDLCSCRVVLVPGGE